jgi:hypothetical protein
MPSSTSNSELGALLGWSARFGRRQLLALLGFVIAFLVADRFLAFGLEAVLIRSNFRYSKLYRGAENNEILILGNSRGVNGFYAPDFQQEIGVKALNLSFNGLSMEMSELLLRDYLERNSAPKLIIMEVTNLHNEGLNGDVLQLYSSRSERLARAWQEQEPVLALIQKYVAASHRFCGEFFLRVLFYLRRSDQDWINRYKIDVDFAQHFRPTEDMQRGWSAPIPVARTAALRRIIELAQDRGIAVRLVVTPYLPNYVRHLEAYRDWVRQVEAAAGKEVVDWSMLLEEGPHFADPLHMNLDGFRALLPKVSDDVRVWLTPVGA